MLPAARPVRHAESVAKFGLPATTPAPMPTTHTATTARWSAYLSLGCLVILAGMVLVVGALTPGYSHLAHYISELGARGAPQEWLFRLGGFVPAGLALLGFCLLAHRALPRSRRTTLALLGLAVYAAGYLVAAAFPCDLGCRPATPSASQLIHNAAGGIGYLLAPAVLFALGREARGWPGAGALALAGYGASALALVGLLTLSPTSPMAGLSQRLLEAAVLGWSALCGVYLARQPRHGQAR